MSAGPAVECAASPVATKIPAPMTAPMPSAVSVTGPSARRSRWSPAISSSSTCNDFLAKSWSFSDILISPWGFVLINIRGPAAAPNDESPGVAIQNQRHRSVIDQLDLHHGPKPAGGGGDALG